jgi:hypothetical protein
MTAILYLNHVTTTWLPDLIYVTDASSLIARSSATPARFVEISKR